MFETYSRRGLVFYVRACHDAKLAVLSQPGAPQSPGVHVDEEDWAYEIWLGTDDNMKSVIQRLVSSYARCRN